MRISGILLQARELVATPINAFHKGQAQRLEMCVKRIDGLSIVVREDGGGDEFGGNFHVSQGVYEVKFLSRQNLSWTELEDDENVPSSEWSYRL